MIASDIDLDVVAKGFPVVFPGDEFSCFLNTEVAY